MVARKRGPVGSGLQKRMKKSGQSMCNQCTWDSGDWHDLWWDRWLSIELWARMLLGADWVGTEECWLSTGVRLTWSPGICFDASGAGDLWDIESGG